MAQADMRLECIAELNRQRLERLAATAVYFGEQAAYG
jgi:hypothetical protein